MLGESDQLVDVFYVSKTVVICRHDMGQCVQCNHIDFMTRRRFQFFRDHGPVIGHIHVFDHGDSRILWQDGNGTDTYTSLLATRYHPLRSRKSTSQVGSDSVASDQRSAGLRPSDVGSHRDSSWKRGTWIPIYIC